jgi:broad specificity phosphatase PhoE
LIPLLVIRHGATDWNADGRIQGRADVPLSEAGRRGLMTANLPAAFIRARCLSSPLRRAMETAQLLGFEPHPEPRLIEMDWGKWEGCTLAELRAKLGEEMTRNEARGLDFRPLGGESPRDVQDRLRPLLSSLSGLTIAITHKGVLRALYALAAGWSMQEKPADKLLDSHAHSFAVATDGTVAVEQLNIPLGVKA